MANCVLQTQRCGEREIPLVESLRYDPWAQGYAPEPRLKRAPGPQFFGVGLVSDRVQVTLLVEF